jgi:hypothetical protein
MRTKQLDAAIADFDEAIRIDAKYANALHNREQAKKLKAGAK